MRRSGGENGHYEFRGSRRNYNGGNISWPINSVGRMLNARRNLSDVTPSWRWYGRRNRYFVIAPRGVLRERARTGERGAKDFSRRSARAYARVSTASFRNRRPAGGGGNAYRDVSVVINLDVVRARETRTTVGCAFSRASSERDALVLTRRSPPGRAQCRGSVCVSLIKCYT